MKAELEIFPRALVTAARTFARKPALVGEVLVALVSPEGADAAKLGEVQRYVVEACREEIAERVARRERLAELKRRQRMGAAGDSPRAERGAARLEGAERESRPMERAAARLQGAGSAGARAKGGK